MVRPMLLALSVLVASPALANGFYFTESWGGADVHDELAEKIDNALTIRAALGYRRGHWATELFVQGDLPMVGHAQYDYAECGDCTGPSVGSSVDGLVSAGVTVKYLQPISRHLEVYLRGSASHAWLDTYDATTYGGRGLGVGAGIQLKGKVPAIGLLFWPLFFTNIGPKITAAVFADTGADFYRLHRNDDLNDRRAIDASVNRLSFGFAVGSDF